MTELSKVDESSPERIPGEGPLIQIGQWYWTKKEDKEDRFACVTKVGSNFVEFRTPFRQHYRIHSNEFEKLCRLESNPEGVIRGETDRYVGIVREKIREINELTKRLGVNTNARLQTRPEEEASRSLSVLSGTDNVKAYGESLIHAKDKDLPKLFEEVKEANKSLATWMEAQTLPLAGMVDGMEDCIEAIKDRVFNVSLYAGLTEEVEQISEGAPAIMGEKLRIMQRLAFMDEECLANYRHGGMEFKNIEEFDAWLKKSENMKRLLPFPRCMLAFRVRRNKKDRGPAYDLVTAYIQIRLEALDKLTFLYIRNGDCLYRMDCDLEFGELIYQSREESNLNEPMMARMSFDNVKEVITKRHYDDLVREHKEKAASDKIKSKEWRKANPGKDDFWDPYGRSGWGEDFGQDYHAFNKGSVYYDEIAGEIERRVIQYNRIALIVQGLYDRSSVLHPHPSVKLWSPGGFEAAVDLIYADHGLHFGDAPDFEAYRKTLSESLREGSVTIGQQNFWERREAKRENERWNGRGHSNHETFKPSGNDGPGFISEVAAWSKRSKEATFKWTRERRTSDYWVGKKFGDPINTKVSVPADELFNVSAYVLGDFKRFYADPRTRAQYLGWAHLLLSAEEFHAGKKRPKT